jgi:Asp-tRNA(Asn)/Glu-tRNA(Gln) amidotransferase A subunit family amidase
VICGPDGRDAGAAPVPLLPSSSVDVRGLRIAVAGGEEGRQPQPDVVAAVERAAEVLEAAGAVRVPWRFPWLAPAEDITHGRPWEDHVPLAAGRVIEAVRTR